jgi:FAD:protein FMN transferase
MPMRRRIAVIILCLCAVLSACARLKPPEPLRRSEYVLGTICTVSLMDGGSNEALDAVFARFQEIEARMSANREGTEVSAVNIASGIQPVKVSLDTFFVVRKALEYARLSDGAFDPTIGSIVKLWNIGMEGERIPEDWEIKAALPLVNWKLVVMDERASTIFLPRKGMKLDLGGIAKGYAADEAARILLEHKVRAAVVDLGGNILVYGKKPDGSPWHIGVQNPFSDRGEYLGIVSLSGGTVVTSGVYERYFERNGKRYHHILDTRTGRPVDTDLVAVSIIAASSIDADGLSTTLFALGREKGLALAKKLPGVEAIYIDSQKRLYLSPGASRVFSLSDKHFTLTE